MSLNMSRQQITPVGMSNRLPTITSSQQLPFSALLPIIMPQLDKGQTMQLNSLYLKLKKAEISKDVFVAQMRDIIGDQMLKLAVYKLQSQAAMKAKGIQTQSKSGASTSAQGHAVQTQSESEALPLPQNCQPLSASLAMGPQEDLQKIPAAEAANSKKVMMITFTDLGPLKQSPPTVVSESSLTITRDTPPGSLVELAAVTPTLSSHKRLYSSTFHDDDDVVEIPVGDPRPPPFSSKPAAVDSIQTTPTHANLLRNLNMEQLGKSMGVEQLSRHVFLMSGSLKEMTQALADVTKDLETTKKMYEEKAQKMTDSFMQLSLSCDQYRKAATEAEKERNKMKLALEAYEERTKKLEDEVVALKHQLVDGAGLDTAEEDEYVLVDC